MKTKKEVVFKYTYEVSIGGPPSLQKAQTAFNQAWGFDDGHCNYINSVGYIVGKPGANDADFMEASRVLYCYERLTIEVSLYKDGKRSYKLLDKK